MKIWHMICKAVLWTVVVSCGVVFLIRTLSMEYHYRAKSQAVKIEKLEDKVNHLEDMLTEFCDITADVTLVNGVRIDWLERKVGHRSPLYGVPSEVYYGEVTGGK